jgi:hypothetical protein
MNNGNALATRKLEILSLKIKDWTGHPRLLDPSFESPIISEIIFP